jgi:CSLREA domain-containing protein
MPRRVWPVCVAVLAVLGVALTVVPLHAATITVNSTADVINPRDRQCTLREAVIAANTNVASGSGAGECPKGDPGGDQIVFQDPPGSPDVYALAIPPSATNDAQTGDLNITEDLIITGNGGLSFFLTETIIDGGHLDRVFHIGPGISVQFERLTIRNGAVIDHGAGIANDMGTLVLRQSSIVGNGATCGFPGCAVSGAGLWNRGTLTIEGSVIGENLALCTTATCTAFGGGIFNDNGGFLFLDKSVILYNDARCNGEGCFARGGGIWNTESVTLVQSVVLNNGVECDAEGGLICDAQGGGVFNSQGTVDLNALIRDNRAECRSSFFEQTACRAEGGGLSNHLGAMTISGTSVVGNSAKSSCPLPPCGTGGGGRPEGGGIHNDGRIHLAGSWVSSNLAGCGKGECLSRGGGLFSDTFFESDAVVVTDSTFTANTVVSPVHARGGGIFNLGRLEVERSTFGLNLAFGRKEVDGGGIVNAGDAKIVNTTVSGNFAACLGQGCSAGGGGFYLPGSNLSGFGSDLAFTTDVAFTTFVGNFVSCAGCNALGGGVFAHGDMTLRLKEAIVADNAPNNCDQFATTPQSVTALGANLDSDGTCSGFTLPGTNPLLGPLAFNGGPTATHALLAGSPAIDAASDCLSIQGGPVQVDQRSTSRPKGPACDLGAYERFRVLGGGGSTPFPPGLPRDGRATSDRAMCRLLRTFDHALRVHERSGALAPEDAEAIREVAERLRAGVECPGARPLPRLDRPEDPA